MKKLHSLIALAALLLTGAQATGPLNNLSCTVIQTGEPMKLRCSPLSMPMTDAATTTPESYDGPVIDHRTEAAPGATTHIFLPRSQVYGVEVAPEGWRVTADDRMTGSTVLHVTLPRSTAEADYACIIVGSRVRLIPHRVCVYPGSWLSPRFADLSWED